MAMASDWYRTTPGGLGMNTPVVPSNSDTLSNYYIQQAAENARLQQAIADAQAAGSANGVSGIGVRPFTLNTPQTAASYSAQAEDSSGTGTQWMSQNRTVPNTDKEGDVKFNQGSGGGDSFSSIVGGVHTIVTDLYSSADWWQNQEKKKLERFDPDKAFLEDKRRWGLDYALKEWATRNNVSLDWARQKFTEAMEKNQFDLNALTQNENILNSRQSRRQAQYNFSQQLAKDAKGKANAGRIVKALIKGLTAGSKPAARGATA